KVGHMTFTSGPGAYLGAPALKGHTLAADEINAEGGFLGARKIVTITADEAAGVDGNVKELRRMKLSEGIDWFTGVISAGDTVALAPVAEELAIPTVQNLAQHKENRSHPSGLQLRSGAVRTLEDRG